MHFVRFLLYAWYNVCSAWFLDIRISSLSTYFAKMFLGSNLLLISTNKVLCYIVQTYAREHMPYTRDVISTICVYYTTCMVYG